MSAVAFTLKDRNDDPVASATLNYTLLAGEPNAPSSFIESGTDTTDGSGYMRIDSVALPSLGSFITVLVNDYTAYSVQFGSAQIITRVVA